MDKETGRLIDALKAAHLSKRHPEPSPQWEARVMRELRSLRVEEGSHGWEWIDALFWKLTPALAILMLLLATAALNMQVLPRDLLQDPFVLTVASIFGV